jgi:urease accessory protein
MSCNKTPAYDTLCISFRKIEICATCLDSNQLDSLDNSSSPHHHQTCADAFDLRPSTIRDIPRMSIPAQISPEELHLLYILLDSNLPTGGFVSSSGLESYVKHGFLGHPSYSASDPTSDPNNDTKEFSAVKGTKDIIRGVTDFAEAEVGHYANTTGCFVRDSWTLVNSFLSLHPRENDDGERLRTILGKVEELDGYHESTLLSHVARRASKAQGVAMLTLFGRGLTRPVGFEPDHGEDEGQVEDERVKEKKSKDLIDAYKLLVRKGSVPGHLAICWGIITAALGLALGTYSQES